MSTERRALLLCVLLAGCGSGPRGVLLGRAFFEGEPSSAGIVVSVAGPSQGSTVTDDDGNFSVGGLAPGTFSVVIVARDSVEGSRTFTAPLEGAEARLDDVVFHPTGRAAGVVRDAATHQPLEGALVLSPTSRSTATSGSDGAFELTGIAVGEATVVVSASGYLPALQNVQAKRDSPFDVGVLSLVPGSAAEGPTGLGGRVRLADGSPAPGARVHARSAAVERDTHTAVDGTFHFEELTTGVVTLDVTLEGFEAKGLTVLALAGTNGLIIDTNGLFPLEQNEIVLTSGHLISPLTNLKSTPDHRTLIGVTVTAYGFNLRATPIDGGVPVDLLEPTELGASRPDVVGFGPDSTTLAVAASDVGTGRSQQLFLVSTVSQGRQLIADHGCVLGTHGDVLFAIVGGDCYSGGTVSRVPLRFGAQPVAVGTISALHRLDLDHDQIIDTTPIDTNTVSLDVLSVGPVPSRRRLVDQIVNANITVSPDGRLVVYEEATARALRSFAVVNVATGVSTHLVDGGEAWTPLFPSDGSVVLNTGTWNTWSTWVLRPGAAQAVMVASQGQPNPAPDGGLVAIHRPDFVNGGAGPLSLVSAAGGPEQPLTTDAVWSRWSADGQHLWFLDQVVGSRRRCRLARASRSGVIETAAEGVAVGTYPGFSSDEGLVSLVVRDANDAPFAALLETRTLRQVILDAVDPAHLPDSQSWTFSPGGRWVAYRGLPQQPSAFVIRSTNGGPRLPVVVGGLSWLDDTTALITRPAVTPWSSLGGTYLARF